MLRKARKSDVVRIAQIHYNELNSDFLPSLGIDFLKKLYIDFVSNRKVEVIVFDYKGKVCGFIVGATDFDKIFKKIIVKNFFVYAYIIAQKLITKPSIIKNVFETLLYTNKEGTSPTTELVVIAVSSEFHRKGIGHKLVQTLEDKFVKRKVNNYKVSVNKKNKNANNFYKSLGFLKIKEFSLYNKQINLLTKKII